MKKSSLVVAVAFMAALTFTSCKKCKDCSQDVTGGTVDTPPEEYCGDDLKEKEATPGWTCN